MRIKCGYPISAPTTAALLLLIAFSNDASAEDVKCDSLEKYVKAAPNFKPGECFSGEQPWVDSTREIMATCEAYMRERPTSERIKPILEKIDSEAEDAAAAAEADGHRYGAAHRAGRAGAAGQAKKIEVLNTQVFKPIQSVAAKLASLHKKVDAFNTSMKSSCTRDGTLKQFSDSQSASMAAGSWKRDMVGFLRDIRTMVDADLVAARQQMQGMGLSIAQLEQMGRLNATTSNDLSTLDNWWDRNSQYVMAGGAAAAVAAVAAVALTSNKGDDKGKPPEANAATPDRPPVPVSSPNTPHLCLRSGNTQAPCSAIPMASLPPGDKGNALTAEFICNANAENCQPISAEVSSLSAGQTLCAGGVENESGTSCGSPIPEVAATSNTTASTQ